MDFEQLPAEARAQRYRERAGEQMKLAAATAQAETRVVCLELAALWTRLAAAADGRPREAPPEDQPTA